MTVTIFNMMTTCSSLGGVTASLMNELKSQINDSTEKKNTLKTLELKKKKKEALLFKRCEYRSTPGTACSVCVGAPRSLSQTTVTQKRSGSPAFVAIETIVSG